MAEDFYFKVYSTISGNQPNPLIFTGIVEDITYEGEGIKEKMTLEGRDYSARLFDRTVEPEVYNNLQAGSIVQDLVNKYSDNLTFSGVQVIGDPIKRITFNQVPLYDAIKQLSDIGNMQFYVDNYKDVHFESAGSTSSGYTFNNTNVIEGDFKEQRDTCFNQVWVYGDRYLDAYRETITFGSPVGSSLFLVYKPSNTQITIGGNYIQPGGILNMSIGSVTKYLVDYDERQIVFVSGTTQGDNIPASGTSVIVDYQRSLPIVKVIDDNTSQSLYGKRVKVIIDKNIKDPDTAETIMLSNINQLATPAVEGNILVEGVADLIPGQTCVVDFPREGVDNQTYTIISADYRIDKESALHDRIITAKVNKKLPDLTDKIKQVILDLKKIQAGDIDNTDILTRYQQSTGSLSIATSGLEVWRRYTGSDFLWGRENWQSTSGTGGLYWDGTYAYPNFNLVWSGGYS